MEVSDETEVASARGFPDRNREALPSAQSVRQCRDGGQGGIRTHGGLAPTAVFKTAALNHSATCPCGVG